MATQTDFLEITKVEKGQKTADVFINTAVNDIAKAFHDVVTTDLTSETSPYTLPYDSTAGGVKTALRAGVFKFTGTLTGNMTIIHPNKKHWFIAENSTTGGFQLTVKTLAGTGITMNTGEGRYLYCDGTNVENKTFASGVSVTSVFGRGGAVVATEGDYDLGELGDVDTTGATTGDILKYDGAEWVPDTNAGAFYVSFAFEGNPDADIKVANIVFAENIQFPVNFVGSQAKQDTLPSSSAVFNIQRNAVNVGTLTFPTSSQSGSFVLSSATNFNIGDRLQIRSPNPQVSGFSAMAVTLKGTRI